LLAGGQRDLSGQQVPLIVSKNNKLGVGFPNSYLNVELRAALAFRKAT